MILKVVVKLKQEKKLLYKMEKDYREEMNKLKDKIINNKRIIFSTDDPPNKSDYTIEKLNSNNYMESPCEKYDIMFSKINLFLKLNNISYEKNISNKYCCQFKFEHTL